MESANKRLASLLIILLLLLDLVSQTTSAGVMSFVTNDALQVSASNWPTNGGSIIYLPFVINGRPGMVFVPAGEIQMGCNEDHNVG
jgi:hypothetical protein